MRGLRLAVSITLLLGGLFSSSAVGAQQAAKVTRIGYLAGNVAAIPRVREAFGQGLRDLGYVEGSNVVIDNRDAEGKFERLPALAAELVGQKVVSSSPRTRLLPWLPNRRPGLYPSFSPRPVIRSGAGSLRALGGRAAMSPE